MPRPLINHSAIVAVISEIILDNKAIQGIEIP